jgi:hypothetical protein
VENIPESAAEMKAHVVLPTTCGTSSQLTNIPDPFDNTSRTRHMLHRLQRVSCKHFHSFASECKSALFRRPKCFCTVPRTSLPVRTCGLVGTSIWPVLKLILEASCSTSRCCSRAPRYKCCIYPGRDAVNNLPLWKQPLSRPCVRQTTRCIQDRLRKIKLKCMPSRKTLFLFDTGWVEPTNCPRCECQDRPDRPNRARQSCSSPLPVEQNSK